METRVIKLADIKPAPYNPRVQLTEKDQEYKALDASIAESGLVLPGRQRPTPWWWTWMRPRPRPCASP